jgi:hypothetical protein
MYSLITPRKFGLGILQYPDQLEKRVLASLRCAEDPVAASFDAA